MIRFLLSFCVVAIMAIPAEAQLFQRVQRYQPAFQSCPGGVCPVPSMQVVPMRTAPVFQFQNPVRINRPIVNPVVVSVPVVSTVVNPSFAPSPAITALSGEFRSRMALRLALSRQVVRGNSDARVVLNNREMFNAMLESLQAEHSAGVASGEIQGKLTDFFEWVFEHQDQIADLIKLIISLFGGA